jgi:hypothetical protein
MFDISKAVASAAFITKNCDDISIFILMKMMYCAERNTLAEWHRPITGDSFASLKKGPILSRTYDLIKGNVSATNSDMVKWSKHFSPREGDKIKLLADPDFRVLSKLEVIALKASIEEINSLIKAHGLIADELHKRWPEWKDPAQFGQGSIPLTVEEVLSEVVEDPDEVERIVLDIKAVASAKAALQVAA